MQKFARTAEISPKVTWGYFLCSLCMFMLCFYVLCLGSVLFLKSLGKYKTLKHKTWQDYKQAAPLPRRAQRVRRA